MAKKDTFVEGRIYARIAGPKVRMHPLNFWEQCTDNLSTALYCRIRLVRPWIFQVIRSTWLRCPSHFRTFSQIFTVSSHNSLEVSGDESSSSRRKNRQMNMSLRIELSLADLDFKAEFIAAVKAVHFLSCNRLRFSSQEDLMELLFKTPQVDLGGFFCPRLRLFKTFIILGSRTDCADSEQFELGRWSILLTTSYSWKENIRRELGSNPGTLATIDHFNH